MNMIYRYVFIFLAKNDGHPPCKLRRVMSTSGSSATAAAPTQLPAPVAVVTTMADDGRKAGNPIMFSDSSDDSSGGTNTSKVINNELVSFT